MNCYQLQTRLGSYLDGELEESEVEPIRVHLKECSQCGRELEILKQINDLAKLDLHSEPEPAFWRDLPTTVVNRLGLTRKAGFAERVFSAVRGLTLPRPVGYALATAFAAAILFLLSQRFLNAPDRPNAVTRSPAIQNERVDAGSAEQVATPEHPVDENVVAAHLSEKVGGTAQQTDSGGAALQAHPEPRADVATSEAVDFGTLEQANGEDVQPLSEARTGPIRYVAAHGLIERRLQERPRITELLFPIPIEELLIAFNRPETDSDKNLQPLVPGSFSLDMSNELPTPSLQEGGDVSDKVNDLESNFVETLRFVEESSSIEEKENIWLSYVNRQNDPTYRFLGIYYLAQVMFAEAQKSRNVEQAKQALAFHNTHRKSLRFQMGAKRFNERIEVLQKLAKQN